MAKADSIPPFPSDIDRDAFGHWLSGLTDGEGSFMLAVINRNNQRKQPVARFQIKLRSDEFPILQMIQSYWECGAGVHGECRGNGHCPMRSFNTRRIIDLVKVVVPHFRRYPLRAKKARDFTIWAQGVALIASKICDSSGLFVLPHNQYLRRWDAHSMAKFTSLHDALKLQRKYQSPAVVPVPIKDQPGLFDSLP